MSLARSKRKRFLCNLFPGCLIEKTLLTSQVWSVNRRRLERLKMKCYRFYAHFLFVPSSTTEPVQRLSQVAWNHYPSIADNKLYKNIFISFEYSKKNLQLLLLCCCSNNNFIISIIIDFSGCLVITQSSKKRPLLVRMVFWWCMIIVIVTLQTFSFWLKLSK